MTNAVALRLVQADTAPRANTAIIGTIQRSAPGQAGPERRRSDRYPVRGQARLIATSPDGDRSISGAILDDSSAIGLGVITTRSIEVGSVIGVHFDDEPLPSRSGWVARCETIDVNGLTAYRVGINSIDEANPRGVA